MMTCLLALTGLICRAPPYPPSPVVASVQFAPREEILIAARGSDNWPLTWGDDDALYTAYGDGWGFEPGTERKLSLGLAKVLGFPPRFRGLNLRSQSAERVGDGAAGPKASGLLMVRGVLYMWVRNLGNARVWRSVDRGRTWEQGFTFTTSFGCPAFLNDGRDYAGARDGYVYTYSQDGPGAYEPYDGVVLARAPIERVMERSAYEFYAGTGEEGQPVWTRDLERRVPVFRFPGRCERLDVACHPGLGRYLLALGFDHRGGWGIFDAPRPWGPWTTAFFTERWDCGDTHGYRLPTKWMRHDGREMWLVFSGRDDYDAFCVRRMELQVDRPDPQGARDGLQAEPR